MCFELSLEEDKVSAMNITTVSTTDSTTFSAKLSGSDIDKKNGKQTQYVNIV